MRRGCWRCSSRRCLPAERLELVAILRSNIFTTFLSRFRIHSYARYWFDNSVRPSVRHTLALLVLRMGPIYLSIYLSEMCRPSSSEAGRRHLRSANRGQLAVPRYRLTTAGRRAFSCAGPSAWNSLPEYLTVDTLTLVEWDWAWFYVCTNTQYRLYGRRILQVWWPNQQCESTEEGWLVIQTGLSLTRLTSPLTLDYFKRSLKYFLCARYWHSAWSALGICNDSAL